MAERVPSLRVVRGTGAAPLRPTWPEPKELAVQPPRWRRMLPVALVVVVLFAVGWMLGTFRGTGPDRAPGSTFPVLRWLGMGGVRHECAVTSQPEGAWIAVDGKDLARRTPTRLDLTPGEHQITLTLPDLGTATFPVRGERGQKTTLNAPLTGSLEIHTSDGATPVKVSVDGNPQGYAPTKVENLSPGPHEVRFSAPGMPPWGQTVEIRVHQASEITARPFQSPGTGMIDVRAFFTGEDGADALKGASVWVDGQRAGSTPLTLELASGPHSIRAEYRGEQLPVQVIDLPGGNQRFATFHFGTGVDVPRLTLLAPTAVLPRDRAAIVSVNLDAVGDGDVREMWLHVRTPDGTWRRYPMALLSAPGGVVGVAVFPLAMLDAKGRAAHYMSAVTTAGDEYFTEVQNP